jgi:hypothetical protein
MSLVMKRKYGFTFQGDKHEWVPADSAVVYVDTVPFVKLNPRDTGLVKLIMCDNVPKNPSLCNVENYKGLVKLRNEAQRQALDEVPSCPRICPIFVREAGIAKAKEKARRRSRGEMRDGRESMQTISVDVCGQRVRFVRPMHPCEDMVVEMTAVGIEAIVTFLRQGGIGPGDVLHKRSYQKDRGFWSCGSAGVVRKSDEQGKRFKCVRKAREDDLASDHVESDGDAAEHEEFEVQDGDIDGEKLDGASSDST